MAITLAFLVLFWQTSTGASLAGSTIRSGTNEPVGNARILLTRVEGQVADSITVLAGGDGKFRIANIPPGNYRVFADRVGYVRAEYGRRGVNGRGSPITLARGQAMNDITLTMIPTGVITGRVIEEPGEPLSRVYVRAWKASYEGGERLLIRGPETQTNDLGEYRLYNLRPGFYFLSAMPYTPSYIDGNQYLTPTPPCPDCRGEGAASRSLGNILRNGGFIDPLALNHQTFIPQYYPGVASTADAKPLEVRAGATVSGINLGIARVRGVHIRGQVIDGTTGEPYDASGDPVCLATPQLQKVSPMGRNAGVFQLTGVAPGRIRIRCVTSSLGGDITFDVGESDIDNIQIVLHPLIHIDGHVHIEGSATAADVQAFSKIRVQFEAYEQGTPVRADGFFTMSGVIPGDYRLMLAGLPANAYLKAARYGETDALQNSFHIDAEHHNTLELLVSPNGGRLIGTVVDDNGYPTPGATLAVVPGAEGRNRLDLYRSANADADGRFHLDGLPPGQYKIFAWDDMENDAWRDPDIFHFYEDRGELAQVREGAAEDLILKIIK